MLSKRLSLIIISIILGLSLIAGITTAIVVTQPKTDAYEGAEEDVSIGNLLAEDGSLRNPATVTILLDKIDAIGSVSGVVTAQNINNGNPLIFEMGEVNGNPIYWQVVYRTGDYITVWMCEPYTTTRYMAVYNLRLLRHSPKLSIFLAEHSTATQHHNYWLYGK